MINIFQSQQIGQVDETTIDTWETSLPHPLNPLDEVWPSASQEISQGTLSGRNQVPISSF